VVGVVVVVVVVVIVNYSDEQAREYTGGDKATARAATHSLRRWGSVNTFA